MDNSRDNDKYIDKQELDKYSKVMTCSDVMSYRKKFFSFGLNISIEDAILAHLLKCSMCRELYTVYANTIGIKNFNALVYARSFLKKHQDISSGLQVAKILKGYNFASTKLKDTSESDISSWEEEAKAFNITKLMHLKVFRELSLSQNNKTTDIDYTNFFKHILLKITRNIDMLERCYNIEYKEDNK